MMQSLARNGKLENLRAVVVGHFSEMLGMDKFGVADACAVISAYTRPLGIPCRFRIPRGAYGPQPGGLPGTPGDGRGGRHGRRVEFARED